MMYKTDIVNRSTLTDKDDLKIFRGSLAGGFASEIFRASKPGTNEAKTDIVGRSAVADKAVFKILHGPVPGVFVSRIPREAKPGAKDAEN